MARRSPFEEMFKVELAKAGVKTFWFEPTKSTHRRVVYALPLGGTRFTVYPSTTSDHRAVLNMRSQFRRQLREYGLSSAPARGSVVPDEGEGK